ncbi:MAG: DUF1080 domain-containing protein [Acidobacteria bacterium]|nr:DUF1080 domain-containing protein [Acidobacteriota bacterium]
MMKTLFILTAAVSLAAGADNTLAPAEKKAGWRLLFDGQTMNGWQDPAKKNKPGDAWVIENGCLKTVVRPRIAEDLISQESFGDFELTFDWRLSLRGNTGVKYRIQDTVFVDNSKIQPGPGGFEGMLGREIAKRPSNRAALAPESKAQVYTVGFEMQLLDDERHPDAKKDPRHVTGALYAMIAPTSHAAHPAAEWNSAKIVIQGSRFQHWVNGTLVLEGSLADPRIREGVTKRWGPAPTILEALANPKPRGPICLQHHGDEVWFKNLKVRAGVR